MNIIVMRISGQIFRLPGTPWDYHNNCRPSAAGLGGLTACEVLLPGPDAVVTLTPRPAELLFPHVIQFEDGASEIDLYDGPKLIMKFRPFTLEQMKAVEIRS